MPKPSTRHATTISRRNLLWLWPTRIPLRCVTLLAGDPGLGKSLLAAQIAAHVSSARHFPDGHPPCPMLEHEDLSGLDEKYVKSLPTTPFPGGVIYLSTEDDAGSVLIPRLTRAGADLDRILILDGVEDPESDREHPLFPKYRPPLRNRSASDPVPPPVSNNLPPIPFTLPGHSRALAEAVRSIDHPRLLIIDTLPSILDPGPVIISEVMRILHELAHTYCLSVLALTHMSKHRTHRAIYRVRGSLTYAAAARTILMLSADPDDPDRRILSTMKSIYTRPPPPLAFKVGCVERGETHQSEHDAPASDFASSVPCGATPTAIAPVCSSSFSSFASLSSLSPASRGSSLLSWESHPLPPIAPDLLDLSTDGQSALADAARFLESELSTGPRLVKELAQAAKDAGHTFITLKRAKRLLNVQSIRAEGTHGWQWCSPIRVQIKTPAASHEGQGDQQNCSTFG